MAKTRNAIAIVYSDIHHALWNSYNKGYRRTKVALKMERKIQAAAVKLKVPVLFCGDMFHKDKNITNELMSVIFPTLNHLHSKGNDTYAISGNHDQAKENTLDNQSPSYIETFSRIFPKLHCVDNRSLLTKNFALHGVPYLTHDIGIKKAIQARIREKSKNRPNILLLHTTLPGTMDTDGRSMQTHLKEDLYELLDEFDFVFTGHIHKPMQLRDNVYQVGATNHQRKTDRGSDLGYWVVYSDGKPSFIPLDSPKFIELEYGELPPNKKHYYYNKEREKKTSSNSSEQNFSDINNRTKLAKNYLKERHINDKAKKNALITIINNLDD